jgi:hypothetical protein
MFISASCTVPSRWVIVKRAKITCPNNSFPMMAMETPISKVPNCPAGNGKHDVVTHRIVVGSLSAVVILAAAGSVILAALDKETPQAVTALGYTALGALAGMLASIMKGNGS